MKDEFRVIGSEVHFGPYHVATLKENVPYSILETVKELLEDHCLELKEKHYDDGYNDGYSDRHYGHTFKGNI